MAEETALALMTNGFGQLKVDGSMDLKINVREDQVVEAVRLFGKKGIEVFLARQDVSYARQGVNYGLSQEANPLIHGTSPYGTEAKELRLSSFFRNPAVWRAIGPDKEFRGWLRNEPCAKCKAPAPSEAAHVRRVATGSGMGIKPEYSSIPLCHTCHMKQHSQGESSLFDQTKGEAVFYDPGDNASLQHGTTARQLSAREWFDRKRIDYLTKWGWETLKTTLGFEHWNQINPERLFCWAKEHDVINYLPSCYKTGDKDN